MSSLKLSQYVLPEVDTKVEKLQPRSLFGKVRSNQFAVMYQAKPGIRHYCHF